MIKKRKILLYVLIAVVVVVGFWLGGYSYFRYSTDWSAAQQLIAKSEPVTSRVGNVTDVSVSPFGFLYRFSGDWATANATVTVTGDRGKGRFRVELEMVDGRWRIVQLKPI